MSVACPSANVLREYLQGKTCEAEAVTIETHLQSCSTCQVELERLSAEPDSIIQAICKMVRQQMEQVAENNQGAAGESRNEQPSQMGSGLHPLASEHQAKIVGGYRILERIGQGGMGSVYRAMDTSLEKLVAIKILKPERMGSAEAISRFALEMRLLARLEHENIVRAITGGEQDGQPYFVMDFVEGINLQQLVRRVGPLPIQDACHIARLAAAALQYAHDQKVIHRDIKPSNLMLTPDGNVKLLDLGLAQSLRAEGVDGLTRVDQVLGTLDYMSPEQLSSSKVTHQSDIFSLGVTLHELLTGQRPCGRIPQASEIQAKRPDVSPALIELVGAMLAEVPSQRPLSMSEVESRLQAIAPPANLSALLAEYYSWSSRGRPKTASGFASADTEMNAAHSTAKQSTLASDRSNPLATFSMLKPSRAGSKSRAIALLSCIVAMGCIAIALLFPPNQTEAKPEHSMEKAVFPEITSNVQWVGEGEFAEELLDHGVVSIKNLQTETVYELINGSLQIPPGTYKLHYEAPITFKDEGKEFDIPLTSKLTYRIEAMLKEGFHFAVLADVGAFATYHGEIWHAGWADHKPMAYTLYLEVLKEERPTDAPAVKWLQAAITDQASQYTETAYIQVDVKLWENQKKLEIYEGWVEANGLVVPFDCKRDLLGNEREINNLQRRLSAQDVIALFFAVEEQIPVAAEPIRTARQLLSAAKRNEWLGMAKGTFGAPFCYIASSRTKEEADSHPGYRLARRNSDEAYPFGIVEMQVSQQFLKATCTLKNAGIRAVLPADTERIGNKLRQLKQNAHETLARRELSPNPSTTPPEPNFTPEEYEWFDRAFQNGSPKPQSNPLARTAPLPQDSRSTVSPEPKPMPKPIPKPTPQTGRFDLALLPTKPSTQTLVGRITHNPLRSEHIELTATVLGTEIIEGREYRWLEVSIKSMMDGQPDYWEGARLLVNAAAYDQSQAFSIKHGWIAYGEKDNLFPIPASGDLNDLLDLRLPLRQQLQTDRVNLIDALSMLFNAKMSPSTPITKLRTLISGDLAGLDREFITLTKDLRIGTITGECWMSPELAKNLGLTYSFFRSRQVPFGFAAVNLTAGGITINLDVDYANDALADPYSSSIFGAPAQLIEAARLSKARLPTDPNWRVWTWTDSRRKYKAWAEFGGTIEQPAGRDVLLRDQRGMEICVPEKSLAKDDLDFLAQGRYWATFMERRVLLEDKGELLRLRSKYKDAINFVPPLDPRDQKWLDALRAAIKRKANSSSSTEQWKTFAGHVQ
ncbi:MAG: serine/threonine-protein kinase [Pirellulaceae bacterium]|nr:serine/threonine-protein kinase [Pirellulaceae bacterium]